MSNLKQLFLQKNSLEVLESGNFKNFYNLINFDLSENLVNKINTTINTVELKLKNNQLEVLENFIFDHEKPKFK